MQLNKETLKPVRDFNEFLFRLFVKQWNYFDFIRTCFVFTIVFCKEPKQETPYWTFLCTNDVGGAS